MKHTQKFLQQRRLALALPVLVLPFLVVIFWVLGGGRAAPAQAQAGSESGLNLELPNAHFGKEGVVDKLSEYENAARDSAKIKEAFANDPYYSLSGVNVDGNKKLEGNLDKNDSDALGYPSLSSAAHSNMDANEVKVNQKLDQLYQELNKAPQRSADTSTPINSETTHDPQFSHDVEKLEDMMQMMNQGDRNDPEIKQLEGVLDKILDIQHPERMRDKIKERSLQNKEQVFVVSALQSDHDITLLDSPQSPDGIHLDSVHDRHDSRIIEIAQTSFYGLEEVGHSTSVANAIEAVVHDTQELMAGSTVKMRLLTDIFIDGDLIERNQFIYGTCAIRAERLTIEINSIRHNNSLFPVSLSVYDLDGLEGIYIPGAITQDVAKQSSNRALQGMQFVSMDQSLEAQAANAGIQAATGLFSRKVKAMKVTVKAGYRILLKDNNAS